MYGGGGGGCSGGALITAGGHIVLPNNDLNQFDTDVPVGGVLVNSVPRGKINPNLYSLRLLASSASSVGTGSCCGDAPF